MSLKDDIASISVEIQALEEHSANLQADAWTLRQKRDELIARLILEEKMLAGTTWELALGDVSTLNYKETNPDELSQIKKLIRQDYHCSFEVENGVEIRFDDGEITLSFDEPKQVLPFAKKNELVISGSGVATRLNQLKREAAALELICHQFGLLKGGNQ